MADRLGHNPNIKQREHTEEQRQKMAARMDELNLSRKARL